MLLRVLFTVSQTQSTGRQQRRASGSLKAYFRMFGTLRSIVNIDVPSLDTWAEYTGHRRRKRQRLFARGHHLTFLPTTCIMGEQIA
jgi:hypothetical protein